jgi:hypothetical protein
MSKNSTKWAANFDWSVKAQDFIQVAQVTRVAKAGDTFAVGDIGIEAAR